MPLRQPWQEHLARARWFAGKGLGGTLTRIEPLGWYTVPGQLPAVRSELATLDYGSRQETYHLMVGYLAPGTGEPDAVVTTTELADLGVVDVVDAPASLTAMTALIHALLHGGPSVHWVAADAVDPSAPVRLFTGEQSNSTVIVGGAMLKIFRRLEPGANLDIEVLAALSDSASTPRLFGSISEAGYDLAMMCELVPAAKDGWRFATAACAAGRSIDAELAALGATLRGVHAGLAARFGTAALDGAELSATMVGRLEEAARQAPALAPLADFLVPALTAPVGHQLTTQRVHGDFHLGQALLGADGWRIIDFEGEPLKSLAERREFDTVWRDVAGLLRSLDYARSAHADPSGNEAMTWCREGRAAFLAGYGGTAGSDPALLRAYEVDKAIYEVVYETRNRPDWAHIPLSAVQDGLVGSPSAPLPTNTEEK